MGPVAVDNSVFPAINRTPSTMGLNYSFKAARKKIDALDVDERQVLKAICRDIHQAQEVFSQSLPLPAYPSSALPETNECHGGKDARAPPRSKWSTRRFRGQVPSARRAEHLGTCRTMRPWAAHRED